MVKILFSIFLMLHGLVHLLYFGQSQRYFELQPGMTWPDNSWVFSGLLNENLVRKLVGILCILAAITFVTGGIALTAKQNWANTDVVVSAVLSIFIFILFWNGKMQHLDNQGGIGILINAFILLIILLIRWPVVES